MLSLVSAAPQGVAFSDLWPKVLSAHVIRKSVVRQIGASLRKGGLISIPNWESGRKVPQEISVVQLPAAAEPASIEETRRAISSLPIL